MDGWKGHTGRLDKEVVLKIKVFKWNKEVPGRYGIWEKLIGLGETISPISSQKKGLPYPSVLINFTKIKFFST